jgi:hypothetical protein
MKKPYGIMTLILLLIGSMHVSSFAADNPPLSKGVCVVHNNVFHTVSGDLKTWLTPIVNGPNTKKATWEKANNLWILRVSIEDAVAMQTGSIVLAFEPTAESNNHLCLSRAIIDGEEIPSKGRLQLVFQLAASTGLEFE